MNKKLMRNISLDIQVEKVYGEVMRLKLQKNVIYVFSIAMVIYFASVGTYIVNSICMLDSGVFLVTRILMACSLCVFFLMELEIRKIEKNEEINDFKIRAFRSFDFFRKICTGFSVVALILLLIWDMVR